MKHSRIFIGLLIIFFLKQLFWVAVIPPSQAPDEYAHVAYIEYISKTGRLPEIGKTLISSPIEQASESMLSNTSFAKNEDLDSKIYVSGSQLNWIAQHPPVYYTLLKIPYLLVAGMSVNQQILYMRLTSILFGIVTIVFVYFTIKNIRSDVKHIKQDYVPLLVCAFIAFLPDFSFVSAVINNDNLVITLAAMLMYYMSCLLGQKGQEIDQKTLLYSEIVALLLSVLLITKATSLPIVAATAIFELWYFVKVRRFGWVELLKVAALQLAVIVPLSSWWFIHNYQETGSFLPDIATIVRRNHEVLIQHPYLSSLFPEVNGQNGLMSPYVFFVEKNFFWNYFVNIWGVFGSQFITLLPLQIGLYTGLIVTSISLYAREKWQKYKDNRMNIKDRGLKLMDGYMTVIGIALLTAITIKLYAIADSRGFLGAMHGRYFLPAMIPIGYFVIRNIVDVANRRQNIWVVALLAFIFVINDAIAVLCVILPSFY